MTFPEFKNEVKRRINNRNENLESHFNAGDYSKMQEEFTPYTRLVTHEGEVIPGNDSENYWRKVGRGLNGTNLKFEGKYFDAMEVTLSSEQTNDDFDYVAVEVTEFSFTTNGQAHKGYIDPPYRHRVRCDMH